MNTTEGRVRLFPIALTFSIDIVYLTVVLGTEHHSTADCNRMKKRTCPATIKVKNVKPVFRAPDFILRNFMEVQLRDCNNPGYHKRIRI